ncbi:MAG: efflux RND transporter permease subunit, partial [Gammaproteobacteria bacterium]|nr:efflux RND transporter permease subunit [Gammaproteobacteria bacterium]
INARPDIGVNVLTVVKELKSTVQQLNAGPLKRAGLELTQVYDQSIYIRDSISMLRTNLLLGIALAIGVMWFFIRRLRATLVVAIAIPISLFAAFVLLDVSGRTINIISLAGLAFAMGMVLDAAIIVLENIVRLQQRGESTAKAAVLGVSQVWGALLASTATTVAIFLPIIFLRDISGQLFADLAFTLAVAVIISLIIAVIVVPTASQTWLKGIKLDDPHDDWWQNGTQLVMRLTNTPKRRWGWVIGLVLGASIVAVSLLPKADYLPQGKQNFMRGFILPPPGQSVTSAKTEFVDVVNARLKPYVDGDKEPHLKMYFMGVFGQFGFIGGRAENPSELDQLIDIMNREVLSGFPDTIAFIQRSSIFERIGGSRTIEVNIQSPDVSAAMQAGGVGLQLISQKIPGAQIRPVPGLELAQPE